MPLAREVLQSYAARFKDGATTEEPMTDLSDPLTLPCGAILENRIAKAAMTEGLADEYDDPTSDHEGLYRAWSLGGAALHITGNVMVDRRFLERPGNVVVDEETNFDALAAWARAGTAGGNHLWMQINHPGRQCQKTSAARPVAPSEVGLELAGLFGKPRALTSEGIEEIFDRYRFVASTAKRAGFTGVQVHSAHGYLANQFLSPITNRRTDEWGGTLRNRARFLMRAVDAVREAVGPDFPVSVKLNSADFQKGGFTNEESAQVAGWLQRAGIDLLEISGGTYESTAFLGGEQAESTKRREAYFLEYSELIREAAPDTPLMVTGGFRTPSVMQDALATGGLDMVGIARPFCVSPNFPRAVLEGDSEPLPCPEHEVRLGDGFFGPASSSKVMRGFNSLVGSAWFNHQMLNIARDRPIDMTYGARMALLSHLAVDTRKAFARKRHGRR